MKLFFGIPCLLSMLWLPGLCKDYKTCVVPHSSEIERLRYRISNLERITQYSKTYQQLHRAIAHFEKRVNVTDRLGWLEYGWYTPFNGYQYKMTTNHNRWSEIQEECRSLGGNLATVGMRNEQVLIDVKEKVMDGFSQAWIGLKYNTEAESWGWIDGIGNMNDVEWQRASPSEHLENCAFIRSRTNFKTFEQPCNQHAHGLCEKVMVH